MKFLQESAISVRTAEYCKDAGIITDVTLDPRPFASIAFFVYGNAVFHDHGKSFTARAGDVVFVPTGASYTIEYTEDTRYHSVHFVFRPAGGFMAGKDIPLQMVPGCGDVYVLHKELSEAMRDTERVYAVMAKFYAMCDLVLPKLTWEPKPVPDPRIAKAMGILEQIPPDGDSIDRVAARCSISISHFHTLFRKETGMSPVEYRNRAAIHYSQQLLLEQPALSIEEVAYQCGFETSSYFRRVFHAQVGISPREYRKNNQMMI